MSQAILLASASPRRRALLEEIGASVTQRPVEIDETPAGGDGAEEASRLALGKASAAAALPDVMAWEGPALSADTLVWLPGEPPLGKPSSTADARRMLERLSGRTHHVSTGWCIFVPSEGRALPAQVTTTKVTFRTLDALCIDAYLESGEHADKAGAYAIQGIGRLWVERIEGSWANVVGLPVEAVVPVLLREGLWSDWPWRSA